MYPTKVYNSTLIIILQILKVIISFFYYSQLSWLRNYTITSGTTNMFGFMATLQFREDNPCLH